MKKIVKKDIKLLIKNILKEARSILPIFFLAVLVGTLIEVYLPEYSIEAVVGKNWLIAIPLATFIGIIAPIPRYATYPIALALLIKGSGFGVVFALIGGEVIGESIIRDILEIKYLGIRFFMLRLIFSLILISLGGCLIEILL